MPLTANSHYSIKRLMNSEPILTADEIFLNKSGTYSMIYQTDNHKFSGNGIYIHVGSFYFLRLIQVPNFSIFLENLQTITIIKPNLYSCKSTLNIVNEESNSIFWFELNLPRFLELILK